MILLNVLTHLFEFMHKGRRRELITAAVLFIFGGLTTAYAPGLGVLLVGRLLYGLGIGLVSLIKLNLIVFGRAY